METEDIKTISIHDFVNPCKSGSKEEKSKEEKTISMEEFLKADEKKIDAPYTSNEDISSLIIETNEVIKSIAEEQIKVKEGIKNLHLGFEETKNLKPSEEIVDFFKPFNIKLDGVFKHEIARSLDQLEEDFKDEKLIKIIDFISRPRTSHPLKTKYKKYKGLLTKEFIASLREFENIRNSDYVFVSMILSEIKSFVFDLKTSDDIQEPRKVGASNKN